MAPPDKSRNRGGANYLPIMMSVMATVVTQFARVSPQQANWRANYLCSSGQPNSAELAQTPNSVPTHPFEVNPICAPEQVFSNAQARLATCNLQPKFHFQVDSSSSLSSTRVSCNFWRRLCLTLLCTTKSKEGTEEEERDRRQSNASGRPRRS